MTQRRAKHIKRFWTPQEDSQLRSLYADMSSKSIAALMGRSSGSIHQHAAKLGLKKSAAYMQAQLQARAAHLRASPHSFSHRFKRGLVPWNKGAHYQPGGRCAQTQYKPGSLPAKTLPIGSFRVTKGVLMVKYAEGLKGPKSARWMSYQRQIWEAAHGPVPPRHRVIFKPGFYSLKPEDVRLERLELISYADHMRRNSYWANEPPALAALTQLKGAITRQLKRIEREHTTHQPETSAP